MLTVFVVSTSTLWMVTPRHALAPLGHSVDEFKETVLSAQVDEVRPEVPAHDGVLRHDIKHEFHILIDNESVYR